MTYVTDALDKGFRVMVSETVTPGEIMAFDATMEMERLLVFHPLDYTYASYEDPFEAHRVNVDWIQKRVIDRLADEALARLDRMVDDFNRMHEPRVITFLPNVEVTELEDGSFSFFAKPVWGDEEPSVGMIFDTDQDGFKTYQQLQKELNREPTFDEMIKG